MRTRDVNETFPLGFSGATALSYIKRTSTLQQEKPVLRIRIRIRRIRMFLSLLDPDLDPLAVGMDPDLNRKKNLDSYYFVTSF